MLVDLAAVGSHWVRRVMSNQGSGRQGRRRYFNFPWLSFDSFAARERLIRYLYRPLMKDA